MDTRPLSKLNAVYTLMGMGMYAKHISSICVSINAPVITNLVPFQRSIKRIGQIIPGTVLFVPISGILS